MVLQVCYSGVTVFLQWCDRDDTDILQGYKKCVTMIQEKSYSGVQGMLKGSNIDVTGL